MKTTEFNEALSQFWEARTAREKLLLGWGGAVLALAIATRTARDSGLAARIADALRARQEGAR